MNRIKSLKYLVLAAFVVTLWGCGGGSSSAPPVPPTISTQPQSAAVTDGASASFGVSVAGSQPMTYQWKKNDSSITGAVGASYAIESAPLSDNGAQFSVVVANSAGSVSSQVAVLTVAAVPPTITTQPQATSADDGATANFSVITAGSKPLTCQWLKNGIAIEGATAASYTTADLTMADDRNLYAVACQNVVGSVSSNSAMLTVRPLPPSFVSTPQSLTVKDGTSVVFTSATKGTAPMSFQWSRNGTPIGGATGPSYAFKSLFTDNGDRFAVTVKNAYGTVTSGDAKLTVDANAPGFSAPLSDVTLATGATASFQASATGTGPLSYQWQRSDDGGFEWANIPGATTSTFNIPNITLAWSNVGIRVVATNVVASVASRSAALKVTPRIRVLAGAIGGNGFADGTGTAARFSFYSPSLVSDANGTIYVVDYGNKAIRKITSSNVVSTLVSVGLEFAPRALAIDGSGNLFAASDNRIVKVGADGTLVTLAGAEYAGGSVDGSGTAARFSGVRSMASDRAGNLWVVDGSNRTLRRVSASGNVTTLAGTVGQVGYVDGKGGVARFGEMGSIALDAAGNAYVVDGQAIRKITPDGVVTLFAGSYTQSGNTDGDRLADTRFTNLRGLTFDAADNLYISERNGIRRINSNGVSVTIAGGNSSLEVPQTDGTGVNAVLREGNAITAMRTPNTLAFSDGAMIRVVTASGRVTSLAGQPEPAGRANGSGDVARFSYPSQLASAADGSLYVVEPFGLRKVSPTGFVTTPSSQSFFNACGVAVDTVQNVYVTAGTAVYKMSPSGVVSLFAGVPDVVGGADGPATQATFNRPCGVAVDATGNVWVGDMLDHTIRKISAAGVVSTVAGNRGNCGIANGRGSSAQFCYLNSLTIDTSGAIIAADGSATIRRVTPDGMVTTVAGIPYSVGSSDGPIARFSGSLSVAADGLGNLYVAESENNLIRKIAPNGVTSTVIGVRGQKMLVPGLGGSINGPRGVAVGPNGRLFFTSEQAVVGD